MSDKLPDWCIGECQIRWDHVSEHETDMVCLACTMRGQVPPKFAAEIVADGGWDAWLPKAQETFERKAREFNAVARPRRP